MTLAQIIRHYVELETADDYALVADDIGFPVSTLKSICKGRPVKPSTLKKIALWVPKQTGFTNDDLLALKDLATNRTRAGVTGGISGCSLGEVKERRLTLQRAIDAAKQALADFNAEVKKAIED